MLIYFDDTGVAWCKRWRCGCQRNMAGRNWISSGLYMMMTLLGYLVGVYDGDGIHKNVFLLVDLSRIPCITYCNDILLWLRHIGHFHRDTCVITRRLIKICRVPSVPW
jgi:hypothetical protein